MTGYNYRVTSVDAVHVQTPPADRHKVCDDGHVLVLKGRELQSCFVCVRMSFSACVGCGVRGVVCSGQHLFEGK